MVSWKDCDEQRRVKHVRPDAQLIEATLRIAKTKEDSARALSKDHHIAKITLLYDALRQMLEAKALGHGYKITNHECYTPYLELIGLRKEAHIFDKLRKIRNGINYYGQDVPEPDIIIEELENLISTLAS